MTSGNRIFRTRSLEFVKESAKPVHKPDFRRESHDLRERNLEFSTVSSSGEHLSCPASTHQALRVIGYDNTQIRDTLHTVDVLKNLANRPTDTVVFATIRERNGLGLGAMASIASICTLKAADVGITLRSAARFYARHKKEVDADSLERFIKWLVSKGEKGEIVTGMPSEWEEYCRITGRAAVRPRYRGFRSAARRRAPAASGKRYRFFRRRT